MRVKSLSNYLTILIAAALLFEIVGCSKAVYKPPPKSDYRSTSSRLSDGTKSNYSNAEYGRPYEIRGITYYPLKSVDSFEQYGLASWYGKEEHGKLTASGEKFDMYAITAAHKTLPLGSIVLVKNLENNKELVVRINDRGPFIKGRIIDLSYKGAQMLGFAEKGLAKVKIELLSESPNRYVFHGKNVDLDSGNFYIQLGSFKEYNNALKLKNSLENGVIKKVFVKGDYFYRVWTGSFNSRRKAENKLSSYLDKYPQAFIIAD
jgi:rare lipoprotein A